MYLHVITHHNTIMQLYQLKKGSNIKLNKMCRGLIVFLTWFSGTEWLRYEASISHARIPGEAATSAPDAPDPWPSLYATLL